MQRRLFLKSSIVGLTGTMWGKSAFFEPKADVIVYGGTAAGVVAAVAAAREGARVTLLEPGTHLGGMVSGGLSHSDTGRPETIGGVAREFFERVGRRYNKTICWDFEPHVAGQVFEQMVAEAKVDVLFGFRLKENSGVYKRNGYITGLIGENGAHHYGQMFIDATY